MNGIGVIENYKKCYSYLLITNYINHMNIIKIKHMKLRHLTKT